MRNENATPIQTRRHNPNFGIAVGLGIILALALGAGAIGYTIGRAHARQADPPPAPYTYTSMRGAPIRINTRTGETQILIPDQGWKLLAPGDQP